MRHLTLDAWSRGNTWLHRRDARCKLIACLLLLIALAQSNVAAEFAIAAAFVGTGFTISKLPVLAFLFRVAAILPFVLTFAAMVWLTGDKDRALLMVLRSTLSAAAVLLLAACTPLDTLLAALAQFRVPAPLIDAIQFIFRYLIVVGEQAARMRTAALARGSGASTTTVVSQIGVLFGSAYSRSERVHRSLLARGWQGGPLTPPLQTSPATADWLLPVACLVPLAVAVS